MSADVCMQHQAPDNPDDPCVFCTLETIQRKAASAVIEGKSLLTTLKEIQEIADRRLTQRDNLEFETNRRTIEDDGDE